MALTAVAKTARDYHAAMAVPEAVSPWGAAAAAQARAGPAAYDARAVDGAVLRLLTEEVARVGFIEASRARALQAATVSAAWQWRGMGYNDRTAWRARAAQLPPRTAELLYSGRGADQQARWDAQAIGAVRRMLMLRGEVVTSRDGRGKVVSRTLVESTDYDASASHLARVLSAFGNLVCASFLM